MINKKTILYYAGDTAEEWNPDSIKRGLAGSQTAIVYLSKIWQKMGYEVTVYNKLDKDEQIYDGVKYVNFNRFKNDKHYDIAILWREPSFLDVEINADKIYLDLHDTQNFEEYTQERVNKVDKIFIKSVFQKEAIKNIPNEKFIKIPNGIDFDLYSNDIVRDKYEFIYSSDYFRGLEQMLKYGWPIIKKEIPEARLNIYYGWNFFDLVSKNKKDRLDWKNGMINLMKQDGVFEHGRIGHRELINKMQSSNILYYGCNFTEIDCINVRQSAYAGCIPFTSDYGALKEKDYCIKIPGDFKEKDAHERLARLIVFSIKNNRLPDEYGGKNLEEVRKELRSKVFNESWDSIAKYWSKYF
jgi:hypothetical protein